MSAKNGRNAPCPCGSGKKYKKCCIDNDQTRKAAKPIGKKLSELWSPKKVASLGTDEIIERLQKIGVDVSREQFVELAENRFSGWHISDIWRKALPRKIADRDDDDFLGLAACELWKRLCPDRPSMEMINDWIQDGYDHLEKGESKKCCDLWIRVWDTLYPRFSPEMRDLDQTSEVFSGHHFLYNWVQDIETELFDLARMDLSYLETSLRFYGEFLNQFDETDTNIILNFRCSQASMIYLFVDEQDGARLYDWIIEDYPDYPHGYVNFADDLCGYPKTNKIANLDKAAELLQMAIDRPVKEMDDWDIRERLDDVFKAKKQLPDEF